MSRLLRKVTKQLDELAAKVPTPERRPVDVVEWEFEPTTEQTFRFRAKVRYDDDSEGWIRAEYIDSQMPDLLADVGLADEWQALKQHLAERRAELGLVRASGESGPTGGDQEVHRDQTEQEGTLERRSAPQRPSAPTKKRKPASFEDKQPKPDRPAKKSGPWLREPGLCPKCHDRKVIEYAPGFGGGEGTYFCPSCGAGSEGRMPWWMDVDGYREGLFR